MNPTPDSRNDKDHGNNITKNHHVVIGSKIRSSSAVILNSFFKKKRSTDNKENGNNKEKRWLSEKINRQFQNWGVVASGVMIILFALSVLYQGWFTQQALNRADSANYNAKKSLDLSTLAFKMARVSDSSDSIMRIRDFEARERNTKIDLRAYVDFQFIDWGGLNNQDTHLSIGYRLINNGKTPTKDLQVFGQIEVLPFPLPKDFIPQYSNPSDFNQIGTLFPNDKNFIGRIRSKFNITKKEFIRLTNNSSSEKVFLFVKIKYRDIFNKLHYTTRCFFIPQNSVIMKGDSVDTWTWAIYEGFNDWD